MRGQGAGAQARAELLQQSIQKERQWLQQENRVLEFNGLFEKQRRFDGNQRARSLAARQLLQAQASLPKPFAERDFRQCRQCAQVANAPAMQRSQQ